MSTERILKRFHMYWVVLARVSATLGYRRIDSVKLAAFHAALSIAEFAHLPRPRPLTVQLAPDGHEVVIRDRGEIAVMHAIFLHHEYPSGGDPAVIFDLGANVGFASLLFSRRYPSARIIAVEADPRTYVRLVRNVQRLANVTAVHRAVAGADGTVTFFSSSSSIVSALTRSAPDDQPVEVPASRLQTLMDQAGVERIDLLKMDIEGVEFEVLATAPLERIGEIVAEVHYDPGRDVELTLRELLAGFELTLRPLTHPGLAILHAKRRTPDPS